MPTRYHVAIRRPGDTAVLVRADGAMPGFTMDAAPPWQVVTPVTDRLREELGIDVAVLRAAWVGNVAAGGHDGRLYEAVYHEDRLPPGHRWIQLANLERRPTAIGRAIDDGVLDPLSGDRQPWYRAGWLAEIGTWIDARLADAGIRRSGPVRQVRSWGRSALLTLDTDRGRLWVKQVPTVFAHEIAVTGLLADVDPGIVPPLVAADVRSGRLLMEHVDGPLLAERPEATEAWLATMARLAEIQRVLAADVGALRMAGVPSASLADLADGVPRLLAQAGLAMDGQPGGLTSGERSALRRATPSLVAACEALDQLATASPSLDHGDLSGGQIIIGGMGPVFLDWSDSTITHPFLAAASLLAGDEAGPVAPLAPALERAYLEGWATASSSDPDREFERALALARIIHPLHMASLHVDRILPGLEQPWELERSVPAHLRAVLPRLATLPRILRA